MKQQYHLTSPLLAGVALLTIAQLTGCSTLMPPPKPEGLNTRVYSANESSNTVTVMDGDSYQVLGEIDTLNYGPHDSQDAPAACAPTPAHKSSSS